MLSGQVKYIRIDFHYKIKQMHNLKLIEIKLKIYRFTLQMASISQVGQSCIFLRPETYYPRSELNPRSELDPRSALDPLRK